MSRSVRFLFATLCGLILAAGTHIVVILASPFLAQHSAFDRLSATLDADQMQPIAGLGADREQNDVWLKRADPNIAVAACAFDLTDGPVRISAQTGILPESLTFHARSQGVFFAVTDRAAVRGALDIVVMTQRQLDEARAVEDDSEADRQDVRIIAPESQGFALVRVQAPFPSLRQAAETAAKAVACTSDNDDDEE